MNTYTRKEAQKRLGLSDNSRAAFHHLKSHYPYAFVIVQAGGKGKGNQTVYNADLIDEFATLRERMKQLQHRQARAGKLAGEKISKS